MTLEDFVRIDPDKVRNDNKLMQLFVNFYEAAFSVKTNCSGCGFKNKFKKLKDYSENPKSKEIKIKVEEMATKTFQLKSKYRLKILNYRNENGKLVRVYGYNLTDAHAKELVRTGQGDLFDILPSDAKKVKEVNIAESEDKKAVVINADESINYEDMPYRKELVPLYTKVKERTGRKAKSFSKDDIIEFLKNES